MNDFIQWIYLLLSIGAFWYIVQLLTKNFKHKPMTQRTTILIGVPTHTSQLEHGCASAVHTPSSRKDLNILKIFSVSSLLATNFNRIWSTAHNWNAEHPNEPIKWFFLLHGDIIPEQDWVDKLIALAEQHQTDLLSVVVPFKDQSGLTSTAVGTDDPYNIVSRITLQQLMQLPPTFGPVDAAKLLGITTLPVPPLLVNSGCIIVNMAAPFARDLYFTINDQVRIDGEEKMYPVTEPEDWYFARKVQEYGGKVMATREIKVSHVGTRHYRNDQVWGATWDDHFAGKQLQKENKGGIWSLDEARTLHVHSPALAQWLVENLPIEHIVYDFGCGKGSYVLHLNKSGFNAVGLEGTEGIQNIADTDRISIVDITKPLTPPLRGDRGVCICLEVLEHLTPDDAEKALKNIAAFCKEWLVLSWAIEGQNGHGHVNCRNAEYVIPTIEALGFKIDFLATHSARAAAVTDTAFFGQSLYVFKKSPLEP